MLLWQTRDYCVGCGQIEGRLNKQVTSSNPHLLCYCTFLICVCVILNLSLHNILTLSLHLYLSLTIIRHR